MIMHSGCHYKISQNYCQDQDMASIVIPLELVELIIEHLFDDTKTLATCSLVCSAWVARTRHWLFGTVHLDCWCSRAFIHLLLHPSSTILYHIHRLHIDCSTSPGHTTLDYPILFFDSFLSAFQRVTDLRAIRSIQSLRLSNLDLTSYPLETQSRMTSTLACLFPEITSLGLDQVVLHDMRQLNSTVLRAFPCLGRLEARVKFLKYLEHTTVPVAISGEDSLPAGLKEIELGHDGMATVLCYIANARSRSHCQDGLNVHHLSLKGCTPEMLPYVSGAVHALSASLQTLRISFFSEKVQYYDCNFP
ncbi:hypothetical protein GGU11DRAFT_799125 [Lentinula aff. detonsa]|nr:hypothetical protein GGU11DRAFT_799125 [Lentinula aff. detonsa]